MTDPADRPRHPAQPTGSTLRLPLIAALAVAAVGASLPLLAASMPSATAQSTSPNTEHVVLIGFDGFDPDYLGRAATPNIDVLIDRGVTGVTEAVMLPITNPSFTALTTGARPDRNGNRAYWWDRVANTYHGQSRTNQVTGIAEAVVAAGGTVGAAQYFILQGNGTDYGVPGAVYTQPSGPCSRRFDDAVSMLRRRPVDSGGVSVPVEEIPTLLAVYCDDLDTIGHAQGTETVDIDQALVELDAQVGRLVAAVDEAGITDRTTIILTGDHGMSSYTRSFFLPLHSALGAAGYHPEFLWQNGQSIGPDTDVVMTSAGRSMSIYLTGDRAGDEAALADIRSIVAGTEGTGRILDRTDQAALHMHPDHGDLVVESAPGWGASILPPSGTVGDHGSSDELDAFFVMAGADIARDRTPVRIRHIDVAPTIAELLGLPPLPDADGEALTPLLGDPPPRDSWLTTTTSAPTVTSTTVANPPTTADGPPPGDIGAPTPARPVRARPSYTG